MNLSYIRLNLTRALIDDSGKTKGQLQAFSEHPPADKNRNPRKPLHVVELDDGRGGVRRVKAENSAVYVMETRSRRRPMPPINDMAFSLSPWRRATLALDEPQQAWLRYCYGYDLDFRHQESICRYAWETHQEFCRGMVLQTTTKKRIMSLVWIAAQNVATGLSNDTYREYAGSALAAMLCVGRSAWCETYAPHWRNLNDIFNALDLDALTAISRSHFVAINSEQLAEPNKIGHI